eukprot:363308-Chlamydomonas_euryale.AAC.3
MCCCLRGSSGSHASSLLYTYTRSTSTPHPTHPLPVHRSALGVPLTAACHFRAATTATGTPSRQTCWCAAAAGGGGGERVLGVGLRVITGLQATPCHGNSIAAGVAAVGSGCGERGSGAAYDKGLSCPLQQASRWQRGELAEGGAGRGGAGRGGSGGEGVKAQR